MAYRLGVDVGGTFTDLFLVSEGDGGGAVPRQDAVDAGDPSEGVLDRRPPDLRRGRDRRRGAAQLPPRHDRRHERRARVEGRPRRADHDAGLRADPPPRALADAGPAGGLDHHDQARPAGLARRHSRGGRADRRAREHVVPVDEAQVEAIVRDLVDSGVESLTVALINSYVNPAHEEQIGAIVERLYPGFPVTLSRARAARVPRVRAHADGVHELVRPAEGGRLRRPPAERARSRSARRRTSTSCAPTPG